MKLNVMPLQLSKTTDQIYIGDIYLEHNSGRAYMLHTHSHACVYTYAHMHEHRNIHKDTYTHKFSNDS